ncbi:uncharacterized protein ASCRUDRAFT_23922, partial [Ascoidea rubescens DSM 1968]
IINDISKPDVDNRSYRIIQLKNGLEVLLIHDETTQKSSASISVKAGRFQDPPNLPGLAHLCEHVLFMTSYNNSEDPASNTPSNVKFTSSVENEFETFIDDNLGTSNAFTSDEETNYHYDILNENFELSLKKFSTYFNNINNNDINNQLINKSVIEREIQSVDSEFAKITKNDSWKIRQVEKKISNKNHPYHNFSNGNIKTLHEIPLLNNINIKECALNFYKNYYIPKLMKLTILSNQSLDYVQNLVLENFSSLKNISNQLPFYDYNNEHPITKDELGTIIKIKPVMDTQEIRICFPILDQRPFYQSNPSLYYIHLISHECNGSLISFLKNESLASSLSVELTHISDNDDSFKIIIQLTNEGFKKYDEVVGYVFNYIELLKKTQPQRWIYNELKIMEYGRFKCRQKISEIETTSSLASLLQDNFILRKDILGSCLLKRFRENEIKEFGNKFLNIRNFRCLLVSKNNSHHLYRKEPYLNTRYSVEKLSKSFSRKVIRMIRKNGSCFSLPLPNRFLPQEFKRLIDEQDEMEYLNNYKPPILFESSEFGRTWLKQNNSVPKGYVGLLIRNPSSHNSPINSIKCNIFIKYINELCEVLRYEANLSGLYFNFEPSYNGFYLQINGYNEKLINLLESIIKLVKIENSLNNYISMSEKEFNRHKSNLERIYKNFKLTEPFNQIDIYSSCLLNENSWNIDEKLRSLDQLMFNNFKNYNPFEQFSFECFIYGNFSIKDCNTINKLIKKNLCENNQSLTSSEKILGRSLILYQGDNYNLRLINRELSSSCIDCYIQCGIKEDKTSRVLLYILSDIMDDLMFNELRTREQLGYIMTVGLRSTRTTIGLRLLIQSELPTEFLESRIDKFLITIVENYLRNLTRDEFQSLINKISNDLLIKFQNMREEYYFYWNHIKSGYFDFINLIDYLKILKNLTRKDLLYFYLYYISPKSSIRAKLTVHLHNCDSSKKEDNIKNYKKIIKSAIKNSLLLKDIIISNDRLSEIID